MFQEDIYPPTYAGEPTVTAEDWMAGQIPTIKKVSMRPEGSGTSTPGRRSAEREIEAEVEASKPVEKKEPRREAKHEKEHKREKEHKHEKEHKRAHKREERHREHEEEEVEKQKPGKDVSVFGHARYQC
jgi:hypothetical protein